MAQDDSQVNPSAWLFLWEARALLKAPLKHAERLLSSNLAAGRIAYRCHEISGIWNELDPKGHFDPARLAADLEQWPPIFFDAGAPELTVTIDWEESSARRIDPRRRAVPIDAEQAKATAGAASFGGYKILSSPDGKQHVRIDPKTTDYRMDGVQVRRADVEVVMRAAGLMLPGQQPAPQ
jgi:hypothetical protein